MIFNLPAKEPVEFEIKDDWWFKADMHNFIRTSNSYRPQKDKSFIIIQIIDIKPPTRALGVREFDKQRILSILKAIRKVEDEKRAANHRAPDLMVDHGQPGPKTRPKSGLLLATGVFIGVVIFGTFLTLKPGNPDMEESVETIKPAATNEKQNSIKPEVNQGLQSSAIQPLEQQKPSSSIKTSDSQKGVYGSVKKQDSNLDTNSVPGVSQMNLPAPGKTVQLKPERAQTAQEKLPGNISLTVTEIFIQEESDNNMAVVNGLPVMIGTHVDSAIVTEIGKDHVLFKLSDSLYKVPLAQP